MDYCELNALGSLSSNYKATEEIIHHVAAWTDYHDHAESLPGNDNIASHHTPSLMLGVCWLCRAGRGNIFISIADPVCLHETWLFHFNPTLCRPARRMFFSRSTLDSVLLYIHSATDLTGESFHRLQTTCWTDCSSCGGAPQVSC